MAEYIEREAAISKLRLVEVREASINFAASMLSEIKRIPAADVQPVRHGRWVVHGQDIYCSECHNESAYNPFGASMFSDYCHKCGAKMDGGVNNDDR